MTKKIRPFLKWAGGKRWLVQRHADLFPKDYKRYIEPFLGSGAVYFHLQPGDALLGDSNPDVVAAYLGIQKDWLRIKNSLDYRQRAHSGSAEYYYSVRSKVPSDAMQLASRTIYLNRTCFNGIYRVNLSGHFNVPRGSKNEVVMETDDFAAISKLLQTAEIRHSDFEALIDEAERDDLVFADPPYTVRHNFNGFVKYNEILFSWEDQERLAAALARAQSRGVKIVSTNANHASVRALYEKDEFALSSVSRFSAISASAAKRKQFEELIVRANIDSNGSSREEGELLSQPQP